LRGVEDRSPEPAKTSIWAMDREVAIVVQIPLLLKVAISFSKQPSTPTPTLDGNADIVMPARVLDGVSRVSLFTGNKNRLSWHPPISPGKVALVNGQYQLAAPRIDE
jgi:hypothetical protein